jgi:hypothetical protein
MIISLPIQGVGVEGEGEGNLPQRNGEAEGCLLRGLRGEIDYPKLKQKTVVVLTPEKENKLLRALEQIEAVVIQNTPPERIHKKFCKTCSYFELCWIE